MVECRSPFFPYSLKPNAKYCVNGIYVNGSELVLVIFIQMILCGYTYIRIKTIELCYLFPERVCDQFLDCYVNGY